jgi:hypothetical protein
MTHPQYGKPETWPKRLWRRWPVTIGFLLGFAVGHLIRWWLW